MKKIFLTTIFFLLIFLLHTSTSFAATYYVSNTGLDTNNGISSSTPWQTISKVNSFTFASGDSILFNKGDTFYGNLIIPRSSLTISSYGSGEKPIISGFQTITGWTETSPGSGIYSAPSNATSSLNMVTIDGVNTPMGRWPKTGWSTFESFSGRTSITDNQLTSTPNWTGAEVVIKKNNWTIDRSVITNHTNNTITYTSGSTYNPVSVDGVYGYFIQKSLNTLTQMGDWYTDGVNLYMYFGSNNPNSYVVKASTIDKVITIDSKNTVTINDLTIEGGNVYGIYAYLSVTINITNSNIQFNGDTGVFGNSNTVITVDNCNVNNNNGFGVYITSTSATLSNSIVDSNGMFAGMGRVDGISYSGVYVRSTGGLIEYNQVTNAGYNGIMFYNNNFIVRYNKVDGTNSLITDGAGIYTFNGNPASPNTGQKVYNNIVINGGANGLYNDNSANNIEWYNNVISNVAKYGIHMNDGYSNSIHNNIFNNATLGGISIQNLYLLEGYNHDNTIYSNTVSQGVNTSHMTLLGDGRTYTVGNFGTSDNNAFIAESSGLNLHHELHVLPSYGLTNYTFANWKAFTGKETNSTLTTATLSSILFDYNASQSNKTVSLSVPMIDGLGTKYTGSTILLPYTGIVLVPDPNPATPSATTFTLTGPISGSINTTSTNFTITPNNTYTGTITITPSGVGSTGISPIIKTFSSSSAPQTFTITPTVAGSITLTPSNNGGLTNPSNLTYTSNAVISTTYTLSYTANANGTLTGTTSQTVNSGTSGTAITAVPSAGYYFVSWSDSSTSNPRTDTNVTSNKTVSATFTLTPVTPSGGGGGGGSSTPSTPSLTETQLKAKSKDIKQDGHLNIIDFNIIMANWNKAYTTNSLSKGDMTGDGKIDIFDINQLMVYWDVKYTV